MKIKKILIAFFLLLAIAIPSFGADLTEYNLENIGMKIRNW